MHLVSVLLCIEKYWLLCEFGSKIKKRGFDLGAKITKLYTCLWHVRKQLRVGLLSLPPSIFMKVNSLPACLPACMQRGQMRLVWWGKGAVKCPQHVADSLKPCMLPIELNPAQSSAPFWAPVFTQSVSASLLCLFLSVHEELQEVRLVEFDIWFPLICEHFVFVFHRCASDYTTGVHHCSSIAVLLWHLQFIIFTGSQLGGHHGKLDSISRDGCTVPYEVFLRQLFLCYLSIKYSMWDSSSSLQGCWAVTRVKGCKHVRSLIQMMLKSL